MGCGAGVAGIGATTHVTYKVFQYDANWVPLGFALWSLVIIVGAEGAFLWREQAAVRSVMTLSLALITLWALFKSVSFFFADSVSFFHPEGALTSLRKRVVA